MVIKIKAKKINILVDLLSIAILMAFFAGCLYVSVLALLSIGKGIKLSIFIITILMLSFGISLSCWLIYQFTTKLMSENFILIMEEEFFSFKSFIISRKIRYEGIKYEGIKDIYIITRSDYYIPRKPHIKILKIHCENRKRAYIRLDTLTKKDQKLLIRMFKEKWGEKIKERDLFWE